VEANYPAYLDWLLAQGIIKSKADVKDIVTNELLDEAANFDEKAAIAEAKAYNEIVAPGHPILGPSMNLITWSVS